MFRQVIRFFFLSIPVIYHCTLAKLNMTGENWINYYKTEDEVVEKFSGKVNIEKLPFPPGYDEQIYRLQSEGKLKKSLKSHKKAESKEELERLKRKKIWELAIKPVKSVPMNALMMYMSPNSIQIISIMMTVTLFFNSLRDILSVNRAFANTEAESDYDMFVMKTVYVISCSGNLLLGIWKLNSLGLIPNRTSDWLGWESTILSQQSVAL